MTSTGCCVDPSQRDVTDGPAVGFHTYDTPGA